MVPRLDIHQTFGMIAIQHTNPQVTIHHEAAKIEIHQPSATVNIKTTKGQMSIDQSGPFADEGLKTYSQLASEAAKAGHQTALAFIAKTAEDGDQLKANASKGSAAIADLAQQNSQPPTHTFDVGLMPSSPVKFSYKPTKVQLDIHANIPKTDVSTTPVQFQVSPGKVQVSIAKYPSISIQVVGSQLDRQI